MDDVLFHIARDLGFPALVAAYVLVRLDRRLAHVEQTLVRICAILTATTGVRVEDADEPSTPQPVSRRDGGDAAVAPAGANGDAVARKGG